MVWFGVMALSSVEFTLLSALLGALLMTYAVINLSGFRFNLKLDMNGGLALWWVL